MRAYWISRHWLKSTIFIISCFSPPGLIILLSEKHAWRVRTRAIEDEKTVLCNSSLCNVTSWMSAQRRSGLIKSCETLYHIRSLTQLPGCSWDSLDLHSRKAYPYYLQLTWGSAVDRKCPCLHSQPRFLSFLQKISLEGNEAKFHFGKMKHIQKPNKKKWGQGFSIDKNNL